jgi:CIC family chloride channel protein
VSLLPDRWSTERLRALVESEHRRLFALTLVVGIVSGLAAVAFHRTIDALDSHLLQPAVAGSLLHRAALLPALLGVIGLVVGVLLDRVFPHARGSGIPEVKREYLTSPGSRLSLQTVIGKFVLGALSIGGGFSLGREGPTVQICAGLGATIARITRQGPRVARSLVCVGGAAGIAAAFNTPIAAITFALEEIVGNLNQRLLGAIVVASVAAAVVEHAILGGQPAFTVPAYALTRWWELLFYALLGVAAAIVATVFVKGVLFMRRTVRRWAVPAAIKPAIGGLILSVIGIAFPESLGIGYATLSHGLLAQLPASTMASLSAAKLVATIVSYAWGLAGGIFAPVLFIGGMLGGACGSVLSHSLPPGASVVGSFALVGMGAVFAGAIRAPITSILIIFEMTGDYAIILPLMIANIISYVLASKWQPVPIYDALLAQDGFNPEEHDAAAFRHIPVERVMTRDVLTARSTEGVEVVVAALDRLAANALPIVDEQGRLEGIVTRKDTLRALASTPVAAVMSAPVVTVFPDQTLDTALYKMGRYGFRQLPVVRRDRPKRVIGIITLRDIAQQSSSLSSAAAVSSSG